MKRFLTFFMCTTICALMWAKKPVVDIQDPTDLESRVEYVNDSTVIYYHVEGIQVAQPDYVYTGIFEYNPMSKKPMKLKHMQAGSYIWIDDHKAFGTYILYASQAFDRVVLRAKE